MVSSITGGPPSDVFFSFSFFLDLRQVWGIFFIVFSYCYLMTTSTSSGDGTSNGGGGSFYFGRLILPCIRYEASAYSTRVQKKKKRKCDYCHTSRSIVHIELTPLPFRLRIGSMRGRKGP